MKWAIESETAVHDAVVEGLFERYPTIREQYLDFFDFDDEAEAKKVLPKLQSPVELKKPVGVVSMSVHSIAKDGMPFIGVELGSTWEVEHGVGVLLHGAKVLEIGGADTAFTRWIVRKYVTKE
ncbi:MAG TPA: hypothetical protein VH370_10750 [Humisphaera sp.]|nr:hypothetical protein [Humisphaera sp.]